MNTTSNPDVPGIPINVIMHMLDKPCKLPALHTLGRDVRADLTQGIISPYLEHVPYEVWSLLKDGTRGEVARFFRAWIHAGADMEMYALAASRSSIPALLEGTSMDVGTIDPGEDFKVAYILDRNIDAILTAMLKAAAKKGFK